MNAAADAARERFDRLMVEATGHTHDDYEFIRHAAHTNLEHVQLYGRIVDETGAAEELERWANEQRRSKAGRKAKISFRTVLILFADEARLESWLARFRAILPTERSASALAGSRR